MASRVSRAGGRAIRGEFKGDGSLMQRSRPRRWLCYELGPKSLEGFEQRKDIMFQQHGSGCCVENRLKGGKGRAERLFRRQLK